MYSNTGLQAATRETMRQIVAMPSWEPVRWVGNEIMMMNDFFAGQNQKKIVDDKQRFAILYDKTLRMKSWYVGEDIYYGSLVDRVTKYQVFPYEGRLYDTEGKLINTKPLSFDSGAILVMSKEGSLFLAHKERGVVHHSTLMASMPVAYACMLEVIAGKITKEEVWSGHYEPTKEHQIQFHDRLNKKFFIDIPKDQMALMLSLDAIIPRDAKNFCVFTQEPLVEPVVLPCGHAFNCTSVIKWRTKKDFCPIDAQTFEIHELSFDEALYRQKKEEIYHSLLNVKSYLADVDTKIVTQKLDDREEGLAAISSIPNKPYVMLFLREDSPLSKINEIWKAIAQSRKEPTKYITSDCSYGSLGQKSISEIHSEVRSRGRNGILVLHPY